MRISDWSSDVCSSDLSVAWRPFSVGIDASLGRHDVKTAWPAARASSKRAPMSELPKTFDPGAIEARWYPYWEENGLFRPGRSEAEPWTIVNPPPNVTGSLHIGHALDNTLQDILTRHARLQGKDALWVVGTDHAGIATQMVVERPLEDEGTSRARSDEQT